jgi:hypothetical protein
MEEEEKEAAHNHNGSNFNDQVHRKPMRQLRVCKILLRGYIHTYPGRNLPGGY